MMVFPPTPRKQIIKLSKLAMKILLFLRLKCLKNDYFGVTLLNKNTYLHGSSILIICAHEW